VPFQLPEDKPSPKNKEPVQQVMVVNEQDDYPMSSPDQNKFHVKTEIGS
jgi:hypothetical protein